MDNLPVEDQIRGVRQRKKQTDPISCPVCGITVRSSEMEHHLTVEMERLNKLHSSHTSKPKKSSPTQIIKEQQQQQLPGCSNANTAIVDPKECWSTYQKIKNNRQARLKVNCFNTVFDLINYI